MENVAETPVKFRDKLTGQIAENVGKIVWGESYKLTDLCVYPNGFRVTISTTNQENIPKHVYVEYEPFRVIIEENMNDSPIGWFVNSRIFVYLNDTMGLTVTLPNYIK